ncbi:hypothetical protein CPB85DRAFT_1240574, partial [Mucidula mucida]
TGRSRGFGFVTYGSESDADCAISTFNNQELEGRQISVAHAGSRDSDPFQKGSRGLSGLSYSIDTN